MSNSVSRRKFISGVAGGVIAAGVVGAAAGYLGAPQQPGTGGATRTVTSTVTAAPGVSASTITETATVTSVSTQTAASVGKTLVIGSAFPETGLLAGDGLSGIKSGQMAFDDWIAIFGRLPNGHPDFKFVNIDVPDKTTQQASAAIRQLITVNNVDFILTDYITVDATEEDEAGKYDVYYINHDITGLHEKKNLLNDNWAGTYPTRQDIKWQTYQGFPNYNQKVPADFPTHKFWNVFMGVPHDEDYSRSFFANLNGWINSGKFKPINKKYAIFEVEGAYGQRIAHTLQTYLNLAGWKPSFRQLIPYGTVEYGTVLQNLKSDPPALIFDTDFIPSDEAAFMKQFQEDPLPSMVFFQYGPSIPDFIPLAKENAEGVLFHECRGLLRNARGYDYEAHYWSRWNSPPALADSAQSQDFAWNSLTAIGMAGGSKGDAARRVSAIFNSSVDDDHADYVTLGLGGPWSMRPGQCMRMWMEANNNIIPMGGPMPTYQVKFRQGERPPADGARTIAKPYTRPGNEPTRIEIGSQQALTYWHDPSVIALTGFNETADKYWSPLHQAIMADDPKAYYTSGHNPFATTGIAPDFADEDLSTPEYFSRVSQAVLNNVTP